jgi:hypothetical protein
MTKLCPPEPKSPLLLYLPASNSAVSAVLVQKKEEERKLKQIPVYFASEALSGSKLFYSKLEKIVYAVVMVARKLRHYFEGHRIRVIMNQPLNDLSQIKRHQPELSSGLLNYQNTLLTSKEEVQLNHKSWQISLWTGHHQLITLAKI